MNTFDTCFGCFTRIEYNAKRRTAASAYADDSD